jgi:hypothetical protein
MYTAITRIFIRLALLLLLPGILSAQIAEPSVPDPSDPEAQFNLTSMQAPTKTNSSVVQTYHSYAQVLISPNTLLKGTYEYTTNFTLYITNKVTNQTVTAKIDLMSISQIDMIGWTAVQVEAGFYQMLPIQYRIYSGGKSYIYDKNIPYFNIFLINTEGKNTKLFSIFYDSWIKGQKGVFHWKNSMAYEFSYNYTHPLKGVAVSIQFGSQFQWK